jgi:hypothetical protein
MGRRVLAFALLSAAVTTTSRASAQGAPEQEGSVPKDLPRLILDAGRTEPTPADPKTYRFQIHGEYQLRYQVQRSFSLVATASAIDRQPGLVEQSIGQNHFVHHWLRLTPRLQLRDTVEIVGQIDLLTGLVAGEKARDTRADATPRDTYNGFSNVQPRWLYVQWRLPFGLLRVGQQPNHWGMGILANDGDHPVLFGDYRYGAISERILFATKPGGEDSDFYLAIAGDLVFRDNNARLTRGQHAWQGVLAAFYERDFDKLGVFATLRQQENDETSGSPLFSYSDELDAAAIDLHGRIVENVPGDPDSFIVGEAEAAYLIGSTNLIRTPAQALEGARTQVRSYGGAAALGVVHRAWSKRSAQEEEEAGAREGRLTKDARDIPYGDIVANVEIGYASGDADPYDGTHRRFVFDPNHRIGLLLFDEVLRFQTARAATAATDPLLTNASRPTPGVYLLPSNGGVFGAQYINPTIIARPRRWLDLKGGLVVAQSTSDVVDPYRLVTTGSYVNYRGGNPRRKDLGVELDAGVEARFSLRYGINVLTGAQGGVLFPGGALEDAQGVRLKTQWLAIGRLGLLF